MQAPPTGNPSDHRKPRAPARRRARRFVVLLGVIVLIGAAAVVSNLGLGGAPNASPGTSGVGADTGIGQAAPDFVGAGGNGASLLMSLDGKPIRLGDFAGKPLWIVFWATWCTPCQQEASAIRNAYHAHRDDNLAVLAIDIQEPAAAVREYALSHDLDYAIGLDPSAAVKAMYGSLGLPSHYFLDGEGVIRDRYIGQLTADLMERHLQSIVGS
jgi:cytochrome c biogenesis protein CcmG, thiol:disulfide interchange protein DsbE